MTSKITRISEVVAPSFYEFCKLVKSNAFTHFWAKGGRGSTKSSVIAILIVLGIVRDPEANAVICRKVAAELRTSVFSQILWAISILKLDDYFEIYVSPMRIIYKPTGQMIIFRGFDNPRKIKSIKFQKGFCKFVWYEEVDEFLGMEEIRMANQSLLRGGQDFKVFYSFNPPKSNRNWVNNEILGERSDKYVHHSTYLSVPQEWLGERFIAEAEHLKKSNPTAYQHEYLGEVIGTGGEIFRNLNIRKITDEEIADFDNIRRGLDFGFATDPLAYNTMHYDHKRKRLFIYFEIFEYGMSNEKLWQLIKKENTGNNLIFAESAEPKSIAEINSYGGRLKAVKKGPDSVEYGIKFLQDLNEIVIDPDRCQNTAREFNGYEFESDGNDGFKSKYPDKNNHTIDATRYALNEDITFKKGMRFG